MHQHRPFAVAHLLRLLAVGVAGVMLAPAHATEALPPVYPVELDGAAITTAFDGQSISGVYSDNTPVKETYAVGGKITSYWDPYLQTTGSWSVVNGLLCTFYDNAAMSGGCFRVEQLSANCFDYYFAAGSTAETEKSVPGASYTARAHIVGKPDTCPVALSS